MLLGTVLSLKLLILHLSLRQKTRYHTEKSAQVIKRNNPRSLDQSMTRIFNNHLLSAAAATITLILSAVAAVWSYPGSNKKVYLFRDLSISRRKSKNLLCFDGVIQTFSKRNYVNGCLRTKRKFWSQCTSVMYRRVIQAKRLTFTGISRPWSLVSRWIIRSLPNSILHINSVIYEFQVFMEKSKSNSDESVLTRSWHQWIFCVNGVK